MPDTAIAITPEDRGLASLTHLSGLAGYIIPFGGILVPIIIWIVKKDSPIIATIAKQAIFLNVAVFLAFLCSAVLWITIVLIPVVVVFWLVLAITAIVFPIVGAIKANGGIFYRYPVVGGLAVSQLPPATQA